jgi:hypothetical protein
MDTIATVFRGGSAINDSGFAAILLKLFYKKEE